MVVTAAATAAAVLSAEKVVKKNGLPDFPSGCRTSPQPSPRTRSTAQPTVSTAKRNMHVPKSELSPGFNRTTENVERLHHTVVTEVDFFDFSCRQMSVFAGQELLTA
ncbi:hypothetical protein F2P81_006277 [Scophthalmus maximus]|uniref:Uncharacterized protein n=1 Tax=Scophthalmus maximus TaxID=52904 RepID=A0A6A4T682_SCOMX|nr:hypothetical protein F2P81_006277 [Scophthalmus maximus]